MMFFLNIWDKHESLLVKRIIVKCGGKEEKVENNVNKCVNIKGAIQGVWTRREIQLTQPALPYDYKCFADGTPLYKKYSA